MKRKYNILITGCGGDIGQSIAKILKGHDMVNTVIGTDINTITPVKFMIDKFFVVSPCSSANYLGDLNKLVIENEIDLIMPCSEVELRFFNRENIYGYLFDKPLIMANKTSMDVGFDKFLTSQFLKDNGMPYPATEILANVKNPVFPLLIKSRNGSGSKSLFILNDQADFEYYQKKFPDFIAQELVGKDNEEFTCGLFRSKTGEIRHITYRRKLIGGFSGYGKVEEDEKIDRVLELVAKKLELSGSINVQLRFSKNGPCIFEINPRFSSTVLFRHMMGFEDVIWSIEEAMNLPLSGWDANLKFREFYKGYNEYVD